MKKRSVPQKMDPELRKLAAGMNAKEKEALANRLERMAHELRWSALEQLGVIDPLKSNENN